MKIFSIMLGIGCLFSGCSWSIVTNGNRCTPIVESNQLETGFRLRSPQEDCTIDEASYRKAIRQWLDQRVDAAVPIEHFYLGRAIAYPWISQHLAWAAICSEKWDLQAGTSNNSHLHPYTLIDFFLAEEEFRQRLDRPFVNTPYTISRVEVEKVLIGEASTVLGKNEKDFGRVPFDALLTVYLVKR